MKIIKNFDLKKILNLNIGGKALFYAKVQNLPELEEILRWRKTKGVNLKILGKGTNILMQEGLFEELFLQVNIDYIFPQDQILRVGAGTHLNRLIKFCVKNKLKGLETLWGIPASVGGAIVKNASTKWGEISERLSNIKVLDLKGKKFTIPKKMIPFSYRYSGIKDLVIYEAEFKLEKTKESLDEKIKNFFEYRRSTQPLEYKNSGCVFKNSLEFSAGELIENVGLKGYSIGKVSVSLKHANFFIVKEGARFSDFYNLMEFVKNKVKEKTGIELEPDLIIWKI